MKVGRRAVVLNSWRTRSAVRVGQACSHSARMPETAGVAMEVPLSTYQ